MNFSDEAALDRLLGQDGADQWDRIQHLADNDPQALRDLTWTAVRRLAGRPAVARPAVQLDTDLRPLVAEALDAVLDAVQASETRTLKADLIRKARQAIGAVCPQRLAIAEPQETDHG